MNTSRRQFIRQCAFGTAGAAVGLTLPQAEAHDSARPPEVLDAVSIPDDWWIGGYKTCYHGRAKDPKHWVDLITVVGRAGGASVGFVRRWIISFSESPVEATDGVAYLNRGIKDGWLIHGRPRSSGIPLDNLKRHYLDVPDYLGTFSQ